MTYRLHALREWALRIVTYLLVCIVASVAGLIPVLLAAFAMTRLQRSMPAYGATLWALVAVFLIAAGLVLFKGVAIRKEWLWRRFWIDVGE